MRRSISLLALTALGLGVVSCTADPLPSTTSTGQDIAVTSSDANKGSQVTSIESTTVRHPRIPPIDREAPEQFETATFALG